MLISAYESDFKPHNSTREEYITFTTKASEAALVTTMIKEYIKTINNEEVITLLNNILDNSILLEKTHIVWDGSYRNFSMLVRPDGFIDTSYMSHQSITDVDSALNYYTKYAETFFLLLDDETWEEIEESFILSDSYDYYY